MELRQAGKVKENSISLPLQVFRRLRHQKWPVRICADWTFLAIHIAGSHWSAAMRMACLAR
jgi:hypothetical protein